MRTTPWLRDWNPRPSWCGKPRTASGHSSTSSWQSNTQPQWTPGGSTAVYGSPPECAPAASLATEGLTRSSQAPGYWPWTGSSRQSLLRGERLPLPWAALSLPLASRGGGVGSSSSARPLRASPVPEVRLEPSKRRARSEETGSARSRGSLPAATRHKRIVPSPSDDTPDDPPSQRVVVVLAAFA